jgi:23S rRNA (uracil1939-C5)-methyltransferase
MFEHMERLEITAMSSGPFGIAQAQGKAILIPNVAPGDLVEAEITSAHRDYSVARPMRLLRAGSERRDPRCPYLPRCGGCDWQQISYRAQVRTKGELIAAEFRRALGVELDPNGLVDPAEAEFGYRSRVRLKTGRAGVIGYHELGSNRLVDISECVVAAIALAPAKALAQALYERCREIEVVKSADRQVLVTSLTREPSARDLAIGREMLRADRCVAGIVMRGGGVRELIGEVSISVEAEPGCVIKGEADCFSQVNPSQNMKLVAKVMEMAGIDPHDAVLDLFCGAGNLSLPAARRGAKVTGVDSDELTIAAARENARRMNLKEAQFIAMPATETAQFLRRAKYRPAVVMLDPPRTGALALMEVTAKLGAQRIIYVACNVATLARDLAALSKSGYRMGRVAAFDFFPNTHHVEVAAEALLT